MGLDEKADEEQSNAYQSIGTQGHSRFTNTNGDLVNIAT